MTDNAQPNYWQQQWWSCLAAIMFYTRLPVPANSPHNQAILDGSRRYFPLVGLIVGCIGAAALLLTNHWLGASIAVLLSMVTTIWVTGAFHEDGFADSCDGFGGGWKKDQVLTIMKDSRVGTYATVGLSLLLALKFFSLLQVAAIDIAATAVLLISAHVVSRLFSSLVIEFLDYVQDIDASKAKPMTERRFKVADHSLGLVLTVISLLVLSQFFSLIAMLAGFLIALVAAAWLANYSRRRIGGYTGDVLGAIQQISEVGFYLGLLAAIN